MRNSSKLAKSNISNYSKQRKKKPRKTNSKNHGSIMEEWAFLNWASDDSPVNEVFT